MRLPWNKTSILFILFHMVCNTMFTSRNTNNQVLRTVIIFNSVYMMDNLFFKKVSTYLTLRYKPMFSYIASVISLWVIGHPYKDISMDIIPKPTTPPISPMSSLSISRITGVIAKLSSFPVNSALHLWRDKFFITKFADSIHRHDYNNLGGIWLYA